MAQSALHLRPGIPLIARLSAVPFLFPENPMPPLPDALRRERTRNLLFLSTPRLWPVWPFLPVIRRRPGCDDECGVLYDVFGLKGTPGYAATVLQHLPAADGRATPGAAQRNL